MVVPTAPALVRTKADIAGLWPAMVCPLIAPIEPMFSRIAPAEPVLMSAFTNTKRGRSTGVCFANATASKAKSNAMVVKALIIGLASLLCARGNRRKSVLFRSTHHNTSVKAVSESR